FFVGPARTGASATQLGVTSQREEGFQIATGVQISNGDLSTVYHGDLLRSGAGSCSPCPFIMDCISTCLGSIVAHTYAASNRAYPLLHVSSFDQVAHLGINAQGAAFRCQHEKRRVNRHM